MGMHGASFPFPLSKIRSGSRQTSDTRRRVATLTAQITGQAAAAADAAELPSDRPQVAGFGHFIVEPTREQRFKIDNLDPLEPANHDRLKTLMWRLATRMGTKLTHAAPGAPAIGSTDNPDIRSEEHTSE